MDAAPRALADLPTDAELGVPVPFACGTEGYGAPRGGHAPSIRNLDGRRVTQCALSRVCGVCGSGLGRPIAFVGTPSEQGRNAFHFPPAHLECAKALLGWVSGLDGPLLGQEDSTSGWVMVTTSGFEYVRPALEDLDRRPTFQPNSLLSEGATAR